MRRKRVRKSQVGSIAANFHEGSRSEVLAQYFFGSFGTVIPVPHQEDTGVDLYCTLTERIGRRAWPRYHYTVQVKSGMSPWVFRSHESVRWLIEHPLPLFLCVINKAKARLRLYQTFPRFLIWVSRELPASIKLVPQDGAAQAEPLVWREASFSLGAPVLDVRVTDLSESKEILDQTRAVIELWLKAETRNLTAVMAGIPNFATPNPYETNSPRARGRSWQGGGARWGLDEPVRETLATALNFLADYYSRRDDLRGMARVALLLRYLWPKPDHDTLGGALANIDLVQSVLNKTLGSDGYVFAGVDSLAKKLDALLSPDGGHPDS